MNTNQPKICVICQHNREMPKHMLERALFRALPTELQDRVREERKARMIARRAEARIKYEKWHIDNPLAEEPISSTKDGSLNAMREEYHELKRIHDNGQCVERKN